MTDSSFYDALIRAAIFSPVALLWIIILVRIAGVRSLSKMTAFDFVVTLATGSLLANAAAASGWIPFVQSVAAITVLMALQVALTIVRRVPTLKRMIENEPLLLMRDGAFIERALNKGRVTHADVRAKLRESDIAGPEDVAYMVLETTGDLSILTHRDVGDKMMAAVRGAG
jgi:uncharacterized membrane protein YcaP (DUF421 family)